jgi:hypothetical protein
MITEGMLSYFATFFIIAVAVFVAGKFISVMILKNKQVQLDSALSSSGDMLRNRQFLFSLLGASVFLVIIMLFAPIFKIELIYYLLYYGTFVGFGVFLSTRCSASHTPLLFSLIVVVVLSVIEFIVFINSSYAISQFGPERVIFALRDFVGNTSIFFLAASIMWSSWMITRSVKAKPNNLLQPTA